MKSLEGGKCKIFSALKKNDAEKNLEKNKVGR